MIIKYGGFSTFNSPKFSNFYAKGWDSVVQSGFHAPTTAGEDNFDLHHIIAKDGRKYAGLLSIWDDETYFPPEAQIRMLYVNPQYRGKRLGEKLMRFARAWATKNGYGAISATVHKDNTHMIQLQERILGKLEYVTYQHYLND